MYSEVIDKMYSEPLKKNNEQKEHKKKRLETAESEKEEVNAD